MALGTAGSCWTESLSNYTLVMSWEQAGSYNTWAQLETGVGVS